MAAFIEDVMNYTQAGFPIIYLNTFEEGKAERAICKVADVTSNTQSYVWDGTGNVFDLHGNRVENETFLYEGLKGFLDDVIQKQGRQIIVLKNIR